MHPYLLIIFFNNCKILNFFFLVLSVKYLLYPNNVIFRKVYIFQVCVLVLSFFFSFSREQRACTSLHLPCSQSCQTQKIVILLSYFLSGICSKSSRRDSQAMAESDEQNCGCCWNQLVRLSPFFCVCKSDENLFTLLFIVYIPIVVQF